LELKVTKNDRERVAEEAEWWVSNIGHEIKKR
jgi:hypothetical protein